MTRNSCFFKLRKVLTCVMLLQPLLGAGCLSHHKSTQVPYNPVAPRELRKISHSNYTVEPPDVLQIDLISAVPRPDYKLRVLDVLIIEVAGVPAQLPISGSYTIESDGTIYLGKDYGSTGSVIGMTVKESQKVIESHMLNRNIRMTEAKVALVQTRGSQQIRGSHLLAADGTVSLGSFGQVYVAGMTRGEVKAAIENHLSTHFQETDIAVDVVGYNSKVFYVVFDFGGSGQQVVTLPSLGNETVLDGIGRSGGLPTVSESKSIWVARPSGDNCPREILPVDWNAVVREGDTRTNYQLMPGDRVFVKAYDLVTTDNMLARAIAPLERILGVILLGSSSIFNVRNGGGGNAGAGR